MSERLRQNSLSPPASPPRLARSLQLWTGALVFLTAAYFQNQNPEANALSQFDLTRAIVERGTFSIDAYHDNTIDKAVFRGHYYSDKSSVNAFLGVPVLALYRWAALRDGKAYDENLARYWTTCVVEGGAAAVLSMLVAVALRRRGVSQRLAALAGALWIVATPLLGYSILFYSYLPACAALMAGYLVVVPEWMSPGTLSSRRLFAGGLLLGLAAWTLNTLALGAVLMTLPLVAGASARGGAVGRWRPLRRSWPWALGGLAGSVGYFAYNRYVFHSFASGYAFAAEPLFRQGMAKGLMGATWPRPFVAWLLAGHPFQGLFLWFPITALSLAGSAWRLWHAREEGATARGVRAESLVGLLLFAGLLTYTSAYYMWWGGYAYAPRHLIPALPLLALGLVPWLSRGWRLRTLLISVALGSALFNVTAVAVNPQPWPGLKDEQLLLPLSVERWPSPFLALQARFWTLGAVDRNWGQALGLEGRASLLPLAAIWAVAGMALSSWREHRTSRGTERGHRQAFELGPRVAIDDAGTE